MTTFRRSPLLDSSLRRRSLLVGGLSGTAALATLGQAGAATAQPIEPAQIDFDFDTGNFIRDLLAGQDPRSFVDAIAPMDVTVLEWVSHLVQTSWFDAVAPYHPTAVGVFTRIGRRPSSESATNRNKNIAGLHAMHQVLKGVVPERTGFRNLLIAVGLNPDDESVDPTSPVGIGNLAGKGAVAATRRDGMNLLGDEGRKYNPRPFADYTGYRPVNTAFELTNPSRWQPRLGPHRRRLGAPVAGVGDKGVFSVQHFVTPQMGRTRAFTFEDPGQFSLPRPNHIDHTRVRAYRRSVDEILEASAALTDEQKVIAEIFDDKLLGISLSVFNVANAHDDELGLDGWVQLFLTSKVAIFDSMVAIWHYKARYDAVRPISAVQHVYGRTPVTAWGGPGVGTVNDIPANEWASYLNTGDHPEYPSGSSGICSAQAQAVRRFFDSDVLDLTFSAPAGWTLVEPGITPASGIEVQWPTWTDLVRDCSNSRVWGGVHFTTTVERSSEFGEQFGDLAHEFVQRHVNGDIEG